MRAYHSRYGESQLFQHQRVAPTSSSLGRANFDFELKMRSRLEKPGKLATTCVGVLQVTFSTRGAASASSAAHELLKSPHVVRTTWCSSRGCCRAWRRAMRSIGFILSVCVHCTIATDFAVCFLHRGRFAATAASILACVRIFHLACVVVSLQPMLQYAPRPSDKLSGSTFRWLLL